MTAPIQEPSTDRALQAFAYQRDQIFRRPAPPTALGAQFNIKVFADGQILAVGDGKFIYAIPDDLDNFVLSAVAGYVTTVSSSGIVTVQIRNITNGNVDMLSTRITVDVSEFTSYTAATPPVINAANDDVSTGDLISVDVDVAGTGAKGLGVILTFS